MDKANIGDARRRFWVCDSDVINCHGCKEAFSTIGRRKHHCRQCGNVVCTDCCSVRIQLHESFGYGITKVRVCDSCVAKLVYPEKHEFNEQLAVQERINASLKAALKDKTQALERCRPLLLSIDSTAERWFNRTEGRGKRRKSQHAKSDMGSDDDADSDLIEIKDLILRCEPSFRDLTKALDASQESCTKLTATVEKLQVSHKTKDQLVTEMRTLVQELEKEVQGLQSAASERERLGIVIENQDRDLNEQRNLIKGLERRCQLLERSTSPADPNSCFQPTVFGRHSTTTNLILPIRDWRLNNFQEPLIHVYSDGGGGASDSANGSPRLRRDGRQLNRQASTCTSMCRRLWNYCCCCCKRRRRRTARHQQQQLRSASASPEN